MATESQLSQWQTNFNLRSCSAVSKSKCDDTQINAAQSCMRKHQAVRLTKKNLVIADTRLDNVRHLADTSLKP